MNEKIKKEIINILCGLLFIGILFVSFCVAVTVTMAVFNLVNMFVVFQANQPGFEFILLVIYVGVLFLGGMYFFRSLEFIDYYGGKVKRIIKVLKKDIKHVDTETEEFVEEIVADFNSVGDPEIKGRVLKQLDLPKNFILQDVYDEKEWEETVRGK